MSSLLNQENSMSVYHFLRSSEDIHLKGILDLQKENIESRISQEEISQEGFVTVHHRLELLRKMNSPDPHFIVLHEEKVIAYALVMHPSFSKSIPVLYSMFAQINQCQWKGKALQAIDYVVMGQICIDRAHRKKGLFKKLYSAMQIGLANRFECIVTEVARRNQRSLNAHLAAGFKVIKTYQDEKEEWELLCIETNA